MPRTQPSSRRRYTDYLRKFEERRTNAKREKLTVTWHGEKSAKRTRSFGTLFREFLGLASRYRARIAFSV